MNAPASPVIRIHPADDVVIARVQLLGGTRIDSEGITVAGLVPPGHKLAVRAIAAGQPVRRYNQVIGMAQVDIAPGQHVHTPQPGVRQLRARLRGGRRASRPRPTWPSRPPSRASCGPTAASPRATTSAC